MCDDHEGFVGNVLRPIIDDRAAIKERIRATDDPEEARRLEGQSDALKWVLVTCFGYQGFLNSKFGRIEVHEATNAYARRIMLEAKERLEDGAHRGPQTRSHHDARRTSRARARRRPAGSIALGAARRRRRR